MRAVMFETEVEALLLFQGRVIPAGGVDGYSGGGLGEI